jgi:tripartite-type tricarboxylate transporter receptor subunit TctC
MFWTVQTVVLILGLTASGTAWAAWPDDNPVEVVVGFASGGGTDVMARKLLPFVEKRLGGNARFVVVNKPGAGGEIAVAAIARAVPDAYAIGSSTSPATTFCR